MRKCIAEEVIAFIAEYRSVDPKRLTSATDLIGDLGIAGDDGVELMREFARRFNVDIKSLDMDILFGSECGCPLGLAILTLLASSVFKVVGWSSSDTPKLSIAALVDAAREGRWNTNSPHCSR